MVIYAQKSVKNVGKNITEIIELVLSGSHKKNLIFMENSVLNNLVEGNYMILWFILGKT
jgi:hypothetical protein